MNLAPEPAATSRLEHIPTLPIFFKLRGKRVLVVGGDPPAVWKSELLAATGAHVAIVAAEPCSALEALVATLGSTTMTLTRRTWSECDLAGAAIAIGSLHTDVEAGRFRDAAHAAGVPVNVIDKPAFCDFQFGTLIARSPLLIAITTDGAAPVFGQVLRARIEALLPARLRAWAEAAQAWRPQVSARAWPFGKRRRFWELVAERALSPEAPIPDEAVREACFDAVEQDEDSWPTKVTLVGCGAGIQEDLTFGGARALQNADLIIHDADVAEATIHLGRREARKLRVMTDNDGMAAALAQPDRDNRIVWLGTGDPGACPRWQARRTALACRFSGVETLRGIDRCPRCAGHCVVPSPSRGSLKA